MQTENQSVELSILQEKKVSLSIKREDLIHPFISGNKYRKLKYNIVEAKKEDFETLLTYGGAFSNHIAATAYAGKKYGIRTVGIIRGEELQAKWQENPTLKLANEHGMVFKFISREAYRNKYSDALTEACKSEFGSFYALPEGGSNKLAIKGCEEILNEDDAIFDFICSSVGTGGTIAGLINAAKEKQMVFGFSALKGDFLKEDIRNFTVKGNWKLLTNYHFGGYAKVSAELIRFINMFKEQTNISLDPIYTGKMLYGILDMVKNDQFKPGTKILAIHTGGLQSIEGMNVILKKKNLPQII